MRGRCICPMWGRRSQGFWRSRMIRILKSIGTAPAGRIKIINYAPRGVKASYSARPFSLARMRLMGKHCERSGSCSSKGTGCHGGCTYGDSIAFVRRDRDKDGRGNAETIHRGERQTVLFLIVWKDCSPMKASMRCRSWRTRHGGRRF